MEIEKIVEESLLFMQDKTQELNSEDFINFLKAIRKKIDWQIFYREKEAK